MILSEVLERTIQNKRMNSELHQQLMKAIEPILCYNYSRNIATGIESYTITNGQILEAYETVQSIIGLKDSLNSKEDIEYNKSAILKLDKNLCLKVLENVTETDLKSAYPTLLMQSKKTPTSLYMLLDTLIRLRQQYDKKHPKNNHFKQIINSFIGKLGSDKPYMYQFRNKPLHKDVMELSRNAIQSISCSCKGEQLAIYTDAVFTIDLQNEQQVIQQALDKSLQLEVERYKYFWHGPNMNIYIAIKENGQVKIRGFKGQDKITGKFVKYHNTDLLIQAIKDFFASGGKQEVLQDYVSNLRSYYIQLQQQNDKTLLDLTSQEDDRIIDINQIPLPKENAECEDIDIESIIANYVQKDINRLLGITILQLNPQAKVRNHIIVAKHKINNGKLTVNQELVRIQDLDERIIKKNKNESIHEVLRQEHVRLFADIDVVLENDYIVNYTINDYNQDFYSLTSEVESQFGEDIKFYFAKYQTEHIISCHIVWDVVISLDMQKEFFKQLNNKFICKHFVDTSVYSKNKSLRIPICQKVTEKGIQEGRSLQMVKGSLGDMFITITSGLPVYCSDMYQGQMISHISLSDIQGIAQAHSQQINAYLQSIQIHTTDYKSSIYGIINFIVLNPPEKCIVCQRKHNQTVNRNRGLYVYYNNKGAVLTCSRATSQQHDQSIIKKHPIELTQLQDKVQFAITDHVYYDDLIGKRYVSDYNLPTQFAGLYIIQSAMGTGKSQFIKQCIQANKTVLYISCRKTFSQKVQCEFGLQTYRNIVGEITSQFNQKVVVQIEALRRVCGQYDLVILDEFISLIDHAQQDHQLVDLIKKQFKRCSSMIVCDALLNENWINIIKDLTRNTVLSDITTIKNSYKPDKDKELIVKRFQKDQNMSLKYVAQDIINKHSELSLNNTRKALIGCFCTSYTSLQYIEKAINDLCPTLKTRSYHGHNDKQEVNNQIHQEIKDQDLRNVNESWLQYDIILYTSTITCGISFDQDIPIHTFMILQSGPSIPSMTAIYQAIARFRKTQAYSIYLKGHLRRPSQGVVNTKNILMQSFTSVNHMMELYLDMCVESYVSTQNALGWQWLEFALQQNGYNIQYEQIQFEEQEHLEQYQQHKPAITDYSSELIEPQLIFLKTASEYLNPQTTEFTLYNIPFGFSVSGADSVLSRIQSAVIRINDTFGVPCNNYITLEDIIQQYKKDELIKKIVDKCLEGDKEYLVPNAHSLYSRRNLYSYFINQDRINVLKQQKGKLNPDQVQGFSIKDFASINTTINKIQKYLNTDQPLRTLQLDKEQALQAVRETKTAVCTFDDALYIIGYYKTAKNIRIEGKQVKQLILQSVKCLV